jgi:hypothetical protein
MFTISECACEFPQISFTVLCKIITVRLGYNFKFCARWVLKLPPDAHKTENGLGYVIVETKE